MTRKLGLACCNEPDTPDADIDEFPIAMFTRSTFLSAWRHVEKHHDEYGAALFIMPVLVIALTVISICWGLAWLFQ